MHPPDMEPLTLQNGVLLFSFLMNVGLGWLVFRKPTPHRPVNTSFAIFSWASAGWIGSVLMIYLFKDPSWRLFWVRSSFVGPSIIAGSFFYFSLVFPREKRRVPSWTVLLIGIVSGAFIFLSFTPWMVRSVQWQTLRTQYGPAYFAFFIYFLLSMTGGIASLVRSYARSVGIERSQIKYCFLGILLSFVPSILFNLILPLSGTSRWSHLGPPSTLIMVSFLTYSILRHRLMDINIVLQKGTSMGLLLAVLFFPALLLVVLGQRFFLDKVDPLFSLFLVSVIFLVTLLFDKIRTSTERAIRQFLFGDQHDYRETLGRFSRALVTILDLQSLSKQIIETVTQALGVEKASLFFLDDEKMEYGLLESKSPSTTGALSSLSKADPLVSYLAKKGEALVREEIAKGPRVPELEGVLRTLSDLEAEVSIPLISQRQLIGIINLSHKFNKEPYSQEDLELLMTLANQGTIAFENARLYGDLKRSKSYIRRADRLASLGTLTAGLAHEIRNPLVAIKTLTQLLPERLEDEEFRNHFLHIASGEVDRISSLINELLEFARPSDPKFEFENINSILDGMVLLVSTETKKKQLVVEKDYAPDLPPVTVDREQIKQVFLNILLNAIEATPPGGNIKVKTRSFVKLGGEPHVQVEVTDSGCGIPPEYLEDIFTPFFTTKSKGSGLGLSISNQIIQDHRGYIDVASQVNQGASFFVNLPLKQEYPKRRKTDLTDSLERIEAAEQS